MSDVSAYFVGKNFGRTKLGCISKAAGNASPNKSVEGAVAGFLSSMLVSMVGARVLQWPRWRLVGYSLFCSCIILISFTFKHCLS